MKTLVAYYTRTGTNEKLVNELQNKFNFDIEKIVDITNRQGTWGYLFSSMQAIFKRKSKIKPIEKNPSNYDVVIVVYPIWVGLMPPPIRTYVSENRDHFNKVALLSISGDGAGNKKAVADFESLADKKAIAYLLLTENEFEQEGHKKKVEDFVKSILEE
jgi:flavodoxin